jgi:hypothetical protein
MSAVVGSYTFIYLPRLDSDGDGIPDRVEKAGWTVESGAVYRTDPKKRDTDGDGLTDADEAGARIADGGSSGPRYRGYSNPASPDTDDDGLGDGGEADLSVDPLDPDSDGDGLSDGNEVEVTGTSPGVDDTDGDGFGDGYEETNREAMGLDPMLPDVKVSKMSYATDFAIGSLAGDAWRRDSFAWFAGNLASAGSSSIPGIGWIIGPVTDLRDAIASAIQGDWVSAGFSATGVVPYAGDAAEIPGKALGFVARNPKMAAAVAAAIVAINKVPEKIKIKAARAIWKDWDHLREAGYRESDLLRLSRGRTNLDALYAATRRSNHVQGSAAKFFKNGPEGEAWLAAHLKGAHQQVRVATTGCVDICNLTNIRIIDSCLGGQATNCAGGIAHEAKVGYKSLTADVERQIRSDAYLIAHGLIKGSQWDFLASAHTNQLGASKPLLDLLDEVGITYTIHPPR